MRFDIERASFESNSSIENVMEYISMLYFEDVENDREQIHRHLQLIQRNPIDYPLSDAETICLTKQTTNISLFLNSQTLFNIWISL